jgi:cyclohexanone monooxygenase
MDTGYYATFNRPDVELVDLRATPIERIDPAGVVTADGSGAESLREHDVLICATGFDAMTGPLLGIDIHGRSGRTLRDDWAEGPVTYLGLGLPGFPNLFPITGPGSPSALSNIIVSIEQHVEWITDLLVRMRERGATVVDTDPDAAAEWTAHVQTVAGYTLYPHTDSWLVGANIPGKPRVFLPYVGGVGGYRARCDEVAADDYRGFLIGGTDRATAGAGAAAGSHLLV